MEKLFPHFIKLIAPDFYYSVDWAKPTIFLDDELRQISPDSEETKRYVDRLVRVWMLDGEEKWVLIHVEIQGYRDADFSERMFINIRFDFQFQIEIETNIFTVSTTSSRGTS